MFRKIDINVMTVIDFIMSERDGGGKPVSGFLFTLEEVLRIGDLVASQKMQRYE
jgi:hypothetical protein